MRGYRPPLPYFIDSKTSKLSFKELEDDRECAAQTSGSAMATPVCLPSGSGFSPPPDTLRAKPSPPLAGTLCVAPEVSGSGPPAEPAAGQAVPSDALTSPGWQPLRTGQLDTEGVKVSEAARHPVSCEARDQPFPSGRAGRW